MEKLLEFKPFKALMQMIGQCLDFKGRTARNEYWWAVLGIFIVDFAVTLVLEILGVVKFLHPITSLLSSLLSLAIVFLGVSMTIRRLHDTNKAGWWLLLDLTGIGSIVNLIFCVQEGQQEENQYGPVPTSVV